MNQMVSSTDHQIRNRHLELRSFLSLFSEEEVIIKDSSKSQC